MNSSRISSTTRSGSRRRAATSRCASAGEGGGAILRVADDGPGIPESERAKVFTRFYRAPGSSGDGCGLGLAIVRQIADRYGAVVTLDAAAGGGLSVTVRFAASG